VGWQLMVIDDLAPGIGKEANAVAAVATSTTFATAGTAATVSPN
jgi:hypothetical protein